MLKYQLETVVGTRRGGCGHQEKDVWVQESSQHLQLSRQQIGTSPLCLDRDSGALPVSWAETQAAPRQGQLGWNFINSHLPGRYPRNHNRHFRQWWSIWYSGIIESSSGCGTLYNICAHRGERVEFSSIWVNIGTNWKFYITWGAKASSSAAEMCIVQCAIFMACVGYGVSQKLLFKKIVHNLTTLYQAYIYAW